MSDNNDTENQNNQDGSGEQMSQTGQTGDEGRTLGGVSELDLLKSRAKMMGIPFSNNIGVEALKTKIQAKMDGTPDQDEMEKTDELNGLNGLEVLGRNQAEGGTAASEAPAERPKTLREVLLADAMKLVRCRITNLDPKKKDLPGEIVCVANEYIGTVRRFVPFGERTEDGWHIEQCLFDMLKARKFLNIRTGRDRRTGTPTTSQSWSPEFALEVLDPLTRTELNQLAQAQIAAGSLDNAGAGNAGAAALTQDCRFGGRNR